MTHIMFDCTGPGALANIKNPEDQTQGNLYEIEHMFHLLHNLKLEMQILELRPTAMRRETEEIVIICEQNDKGYTDVDELRKIKVLEFDWLNRDRTYEMHERSVRPKSVMSLNAWLSLN